MAYDRPLIIADDMKGILNKDTLQPADEKLLKDHLIPGVSGAIEKYLNRNILSKASLTEYYNGDDSTILQLREWPIIAVTSVHDKRNNATGWEASDYDYELTENTDFIKDVNTGQLLHVNGYWVKSNIYYYKVR